jgi:cytochrome c2
VLLWIGAALAGIALLPSKILLGEPVWEVSHQRVLLIVGAAIAYVVTVLVVLLRPGNSSAITVGRSTGVSLAVFGVYCFLLIVTKASLERPLLLLTVVLASASLFVTFFVPRRIQLGAAYVALGILILAHILGDGPRSFLMRKAGLGPQPQRTQRVIDSTLYAIKATFYDRYLDICSSERGDCSAPRTGGGIALFRDGYLVVTGEGLLAHVSLRHDSDQITVRRLPYRVPMNSEDFATDGGQVSISRFRATDVLVKDAGNAFVLLAAHHYWNTKQKCVVMRVSALEARYDDFVAGTSGEAWRTVYETAPCLKIDMQNFHGDESGGRLAFVGNGKLLLSVGDLSIDGLDGGRILSQDQAAAYGKTILIDLTTWKAQTFSSGHRNPQGLHIAPDGAIWLTEHGPRGGDELNRLTQGENYGWPFATYGTHMLQHTWPLTTHPGEHEGFRRPTYAWLPDIGVSNLTSVEGDLFRLWRGDLLVASLKRTLFRIRVYAGSTIYAEPIEIRGANARIRDIVEDQNGRILLWIDGGSIAVLEPIPEDKPLPDSVPGHQGLRGQLLAARCVTCHAIGDGSSHSLGPDLTGVVNRRIAAAEGYRYSDAMSKLSGTWTESALDQFLANPQRFAPGTTMAFEGIPGASDRAQLIQYLKTTK